MRQRQERFARASLWVAVALVGLAVLSACGSGEPGGLDTSSCPSVRPVAAALQPQITYDYNPTMSPAELADRASVTFRVGSVTSVSQLFDRLIFEIDDVEVIRDNRSGDQPTPSTFGFDIGTLYEDPPTIEAFEGVEMIVFGPLVEVEGFWVGCGGDNPAVSVIVTPDYGDWPQAPTLNAIQQAIERGDTNN